MKSEIMPITMRVILWDEEVRSIEVSQEGCYVHGGIGLPNSQDSDLYSRGILLESM